MKILLISDLHGVIPDIKTEDYDFVICAGDLSNTTGYREYIFDNWEKFVEGAELHEIIPQEEYIRLSKQRFESMVKVLDWLNSLGKKVFLVYGNGDINRNTIKRLKWYEYKSMEDEVKKRENLKLLKTSQAFFEDIQILGLSGYMSVRQRNDKKEISKFRKRLNRLFRYMDSEKTIIFLTHDVPYGKFDMVKNEGPLKGEQIGNKHILEAIKKYQPNFHICGHMHESRGQEKIGKTTVINPGDAKMNRYAVLEINKDGFNVIFH
ncbi:MAG: metallophosphoesterase family protein [Candidatus Nanoarchaeia archaeon]|nr:metallophosphoesterase family protein [Candidatus Nanoarchaeia archaeon]